MNMEINTYKLLILSLGIWIGYDLRWYLMQKLYIKKDSITIALWNGIVNYSKEIMLGNKKPQFLKGKLTAYISSDIEKENLFVLTNKGNIKEKEEYSFDKEFCDILIDNLPSLDLFLKRKKSLGYLINKAYDVNIVSDESVEKFIMYMKALRENKTESDYIIEMFKEKRKEKCNSLKKV